MVNVWAAKKGDEMVDMMVNSSEIERVAMKASS